MEFVDIKGYEGIYQVNKMGQIYSLVTKKILKPCVDTYGYLYFMASVNKVRKNIRIHRAVAMQYIDNPYNKYEVNHIDGNKKNNNIDNLEWCTTKENRNHANLTGLWGESAKKKISEATKKRMRLKYPPLPAPPESLTDK